MEIELSEGSGVPFYRQIKDQIVNLIRLGQLESGERLPSVRDMASHCLVSLITIRRSYSDLETEGWIVKRQGQGTFVAEDIVMTSKEQKCKEGKALLQDAFKQAEALGLTYKDIKKVLVGSFKKKGEKK